MNHSDLLTTGVPRAETVGRFAGRRGMPVTGCPFDAAGDAEQRTLAAAWVRGYLTARPPRPGQVLYEAHGT